MEQFKRGKVIMLKTRNDSVLSKAYAANPSYLRYSERIFKDDSYNSNDNQNLYITSDDEIKEGDWTLMFDDLGNIFMCNKPQQYLGEKAGHHLNKGLRKIIATTDTSLFTKIQVNIKHTDSINFYLPQPSQQFIEKYIESYNKSEIITDVLVEYEHYDEFGNYISGDIIRVNDDLKLKINSDNTIIIKKLKDSWNRNEVIELISNLMNTPNIEFSFSLNNWIEKNL